MPVSYDVPPWFYADFSAAVRHPELRALQARLETLRGDDELPRADSIDPLDLRAYLGNLFMIAVGPEERDFSYSLIGTAIVDVLGRDATGKPVADTFPAGHPIVDMYIEACRSRRSVRTHGQLDWVDKEYRQFESLMTPLVDTSGTIVKILGAAYYTSGPSGNSA